MHMKVAHLNETGGENPMNQSQAIIVNMIPRFTEAQTNAQSIKKIEVVEVKKDPPVRGRDPESLFGGLY